MKIVQVALATLALTLGNAAAAQSVKTQIVGTWDFVFAEAKAPDSKVSYPFRRSPKGIMAQEVSTHERAHFSS